MEKLKIGFIGLGRMGSNMVLNLLDKKYPVVVYNRTADKAAALAAEFGVEWADLIKHQSVVGTDVYLLVLIGVLVCCR